MFEIDPVVQERIVFALSLALLFLFLVHYTIEGLKKAGVVDRNAGQWNEILSGIIGLIVFVVRLIGGADRVLEVDGLAVILAQSIVLMITTFLGAKLYHELVKYTRALHTRLLPKG